MMSRIYARVHVVFHKVFVMGDDASLRRKRLHSRREEASSPRQVSHPFVLTYPPIFAEYPTAFYNNPLHLQCKCKGMLVKHQGLFVKTYG